MDEAEIAVNERIKQLMGQTLDEKFSYTWSTLTPADLEKFVKHFAELLIRDCADTAQIISNGILRRYEIEEHVGVEE